MNRAAVLAALEDAYAALTRAKDAAQEGERYDYDTDPIVPENEAALAIGHAGQWVFLIGESLRDGHPPVRDLLAEEPARYPPADEEEST